MRTRRIFLSALAEIIPYIILGIIGFIKVRIIIDYLGSDLHGYFQFINQLISYLFLIEAGFGAAVIYKLYKPFADKNKAGIEAVFNGARKIFRYIGLAILGLILIAIFGIPFVFNIGTAHLWDVMLSFTIISVAYLICYFGKRNAYYAMFCAAQKKYVYSIVFNVLKILCDIFIIISAIFIPHLLGIAIVIMIVKIIEEIAIRIYGRKHFPFLGQTKEVDTSAFAMTKDLVWHQVGFMVSNNSAIIVLMFFMNPFVVSIYATYNFIARFLNEFTTRINNIVSYSFGNMFAKEEKDKRGYLIYDEYFILSVFMAMIIALTFVLSIRPFVGIWIGNVDYYISYLAVMLFGFNLFIWTIYSPLVAVINANGLFKESKHVVFITAFINVSLSIFFVSQVQHLGVNAAIVGVLLATALANLVNLILRIRVVKKYVFEKASSLMTLFEYGSYAVMFVGLCIGFKFIETKLFGLNDHLITIIASIGLLFIVICIFTFIVLLITKGNTKELIKRVMMLLKKRSQKQEAA